MSKRTTRQAAAPVTQHDLGDRPLVVSYGVGVDSTAMLVAMAQRGIRPDAILFADGGGNEKPETYAYIPVMNVWLASVGFPEITIVRHIPTVSIKAGNYSDMPGSYVHCDTLPDLAFGRHGCSQKWKNGPMWNWIKRYQPAIDAFARGERIVKAIGYDDGGRDCARAVKFLGKTHEMRVPTQIKQGPNKGQMREPDPTDEANNCDYWFPLQEWGIAREQCEDVIRAAGLPVPMKSACWFCPASKKHEVVWLRDNHPDLFAQALFMEENAWSGKNNERRRAEGQNVTTVGLGRTWRWSDLMDVAAEDIQEDEEEIARP